MTADLEEMEYVVSVRSVQALIQWLYLRVLNFDIEDPREHITAAMELVRLADMYNIVGLETKMAQYIREIIIANPHPRASDFWPPVTLIGLTVNILSLRPTCVENIQYGKLWLQPPSQVISEAMITNSTKRLRHTLPLQRICFLKLDRHWTGQSLSQLALSKTPSVERY